MEAATKRRVTDSPVTVYLLGIVACSACADASLSREEVERQVNAENPTGIQSPWRISDEPFSDGTPNPSPCNTDEGRLHYLLNC